MRLIVGGFIWGLLAASFVGCLIYIVAIVLTLPVWLAAALLMTPFFAVMLAIGNAIGLTYAAVTGAP